LPKDALEVPYSVPNILVKLTLYFPIALVSLCVPPAPGIRPIVTSGNPNDVSEVATIKSA
jgi:hypothetical protein